MLEVGPGSGYFSVALARRITNGRLELLDLQPEMLARARRKLLVRGHKNVGYTAQDASLPLPYEDETFDAVVLVAVLGEVSDSQACLRGIRRVLRPGGRLAVHEHFLDPDHIPLTALSALAAECGFRLDKRFGPARHYTALFVIDEATTPGGTAP